MHITPETGRKLNRARKMRERGMSAKTNADMPPRTKLAEEMRKAQISAAVDAVPVEVKDAKIIPLDAFRPK